MAIYEVRELADDGVTVRKTAAVQVPEDVPPRLYAAYRAILNLPESSDDEVWGAFAGGLFRGSMANVLNHEREAAAAAVEAPVIEFAPVPPPA